MDVALDGRQQDLAFRLPLTAFRLQVGNQVRHGFLHHARRLDHLRQEHLAGAEQVADLVHAIHEGALDDGQGAIHREARRFGVLHDVLVDSLDEGVGETLFDGQLAPLEILAAPFPARLPLVFRSQRQQPLRGVGAPGEDHVLDGFLQAFGDILVDRQLARVHYAHVHAGPDGVVKEYRVHRLADRVVAAERE